MENEAELIRQQMLETRTALTEKLETLEEEVTAKVKGTTESVVQTVETVKDAVENTVETVSNTVEKTVETVKETFDVSRHFEEHPWLMFGGAVVVGYIGGRVLDNLGPPSTEMTRMPSEPFRETELTGYHEMPAPTGPSWGAEVLQALRPAMGKLGELAIGVTAGVLGEMVRDAVPETMKQDVGEVIDEVTRALGGKPIRVSKPQEAVDRSSAGLESSMRQVP
jgi:ElaB/YqjD/DUF883 family membrane-anchored ribosome-binding protein